MLIATKYAAIHMDSGLVTRIENRHARTAFSYRETIELAAGTATHALGEPSSSATQATREEIDNFISDKQHDKLPFEGVLHRERWVIDTFWFERELVANSEEQDDCFIFFRYSTNCPRPLSVRVRVQFDTDGVATSRKRVDSEIRFVCGAANYAHGFFKTHRLYIAENVPQHKLLCYFDYRDSSLAVSVGDDRTITTNFTIDSSRPKIPQFVIYQALGSPFSRTLFLIERGNWRAAFSAITFQSGGKTRDPAPHNRCLSSPFSAFLWYSPDEGLYQYQRLFTELPALQSVFIFGKVTYQDYRLMKHILTQKERLPPRRNPKTGQIENQSKIFIVLDSPDDNDYALALADLIREEAQRKQMDFVVNGMPAYIPRTETIILSADKPPQFQHKQMLDIWFHGSIQQCKALFVLPNDPVFAAISAPFARYLRAYAWFYDEAGQLLEDGPEQRAVLEACSHDAKIETYIVTRSGKKGIKPAILSFLAQNGIFASINSIVVEDEYELAAEFAKLLLKYKVLDRYLSMVEQGSHAALRVAIERSLSPKAADKVTGLRDRIRAAEEIRPDELASAYAAVDPDFYPSMFDKLTRADLATYTSPANEPIVCPSVIVSGTKAGYWANLFTACNYSSFRLAPVLLLKPPPDDSIAMQFYADLHQIETHACDLGATGYANRLEHVLAKTGMKVAQLFPSATLSCLSKLVPQFITLISEDPLLPVEFARFFEPKPGGFVISNLPMDMDGTLSLSEMYRVGRLMGTTPEISCRIVSQAALRGYAYRGAQVRVCSTVNPSQNLKESEREGHAIIEFLEKLARDSNFAFTASISSGFACNRRTFVETCNSGVDLIHFSGHGKSSMYDGWESRIELSDGSMSSLEIANELMLVRNPVVVVNACESGRGPGHLAESFLQSNASAVVGTLWSVFDEQAADLGKIFCTYLLSGLSIGSALRDAKLQMKDGAENRTAVDLMSWRSYILYGDPTDVPFLSCYVAKKTASKAIAQVTGKVQSNATDVVPRRPHP